MCHSPSGSGNAGGLSAQRSVPGRLCQGLDLAPRRPGWSLKWSDTPPPLAKVLPLTPRVVLHLPSDPDPADSQTTSHHCSEYVLQPAAEVIPRWTLAGKYLRFVFPHQLALHLVPSPGGFWDLQPLLRLY